MHRFWLSASSGVLLVLTLRLLSSGCRATTLVAARFDAGVVIGADTRTSQGSFVANRLTDKITSVYPGIFLARSGSSADTQFVAEVIESRMEAYRSEYGRPPTVRAAATVTKNLCYTNKDQLNAGIICAGWDAREGGSVFAVPQGGSLLEQPYAVSGSGSVYALGYCDDHLRPDMGREECVRHVQTALEMALSRDGASGGIIRLCVVTSEGVERWTVTPGQAEERRGAGGAGGGG